MACYRGWAGGGGVGGEGGWVARGRLKIPQGHREQCCVFSERQKGTQSTEQVETVVGSGLAPVTSLLVLLTGPTDPVMYHGGFTGSTISLQ